MSRAVNAVPTSSPTSAAFSAHDRAQVVFTAQTIFQRIVGCLASHRQQELVRRLIGSGMKAFRRQCLACAAVISQFRTQSEAKALQNGTVRGLLGWVQLGEAQSECGTVVRGIIKRHIQRCARNGDRLVSLGLARAPLKRCCCMNGQGHGQQLK
jgi:hypothetical protein